MVDRRTVLAGGSLLAGAAALVGCGDSGGASDGSVTLRVGWWGNPTRNELTTEVIELFESQHPGITIDPEPGDWSAYWEKLSTQAAARDTPDVIQMDAQKIREYGSRGALLDLNTTELDVSGFLEAAKKVGVIGEERFAVNGAVTERVYLANPDVFVAAGVDLPDDATWTWDEFAEVIATVTDATPKGTWGASHPAIAPNNYLLWLRQQGKDLFTEDGIGFEPGDLTGYFELCQRLTETGAVVSASAAVEELSKNANQTLFWTGRAALTSASSNQVVAISEATGADLKILRYPSPTGNAADAQAFVTGLSWSVGSNTDHPEEAVAFLNFILNDVEAGKILGDERGLPPNNEVRAEVTSAFEGVDGKAAEFVEATSDEMSDPPVAPLVGGADWHDVVMRHAQDMLFEKVSPQQAAEAFHAELEGAIQ